MSKSTVGFEHVSKRYYLGKRKAFVLELLPHFLNRRIRRTNELWALKDVSFEVKGGEALGIIGANGSGKTTTLSLLAGITGPTSGYITCDGVIGALIQLGAGFHPELTGRENVYLNASILGLKRKEVNQIYDQIVEFAELERFMDTPVKRYSSGMYARLGFAVAMHIKPDILLVDEVLAVGDMAFQSKCIAKMRELVARGCAVIFVSHNLNLVQSLCCQVMWMDCGRCVKIGTPSEIIAAYSGEMDRRLAAISLEDIRRQGLGTGDLKVTRVILRDKNGNEGSEFNSDDPLTIELCYHCSSRISNPYFWVTIAGKQGGLFSANMLLDGKRPDYIEGQGMVSCTFYSLPLMPQNYLVAAGIRGGDGATLLIQSRYVATFRVTGSPKELGLTSDVAESLARDTPPVLLPYEWRLPDGQIRIVNRKENSMTDLKDE